MSNYQFLMAKHACMESERLFLRPVTMHDAVDMFDYTSDEETTRFLYEPHTELQQTEKNDWQLFYERTYRQICTRFKRVW